ncbi:Transcription factor TFIIS [Giardia muris]|uniref:Transcription factor TFIIS n=1 Tax=Giardia muris TaxID=5742 RepID=A0A4Z1T9B1_GIAMU|nr:Transcription factor TFIIS [Giardia muris]|eukprot:TNJ29119.1 Transcription factor TFIIS [Giardia muris]
MDVLRRLANELDRGVVPAVPDTFQEAVASIHPEDLDYPSLVDIVIAVKKLHSIHPDDRLSKALLVLVAHLRQHVRDVEPQPGEGQIIIGHSSEFRETAVMRLATCLSPFATSMGMAEAFFDSLQSDDNLLLLFPLIEYLRSDQRPDGLKSLIVEHPSPLLGRLCYYSHLPRNFEVIPRLIENFNFGRYCDPHAQRPSEAYVNRHVLLCSAFKAPANVELRAQTILGQLLPETLIDMRLQDFETPEQRERRDAAREAILTSVDLKRLVKRTGIKCRKCKQDTVMRSEKQTRSADEATAIEYVCSSCGYKWREN